MNPVAFSLQAYQWGTECDIVKPSQGTYEYFKVPCRALFIIGVSLLVAPIGIIYNLSMATFKKIQSCTSHQPQGLSILSVRYIKACEIDSMSLLRGSFACIGLFCVLFSPPGLVEAISDKNLDSSLFAIQAFLTGAILIIESHVYWGCKNLNVIRNSFTEDNLNNANNVLHWVR